MVADNSQSLDDILDQISVSTDKRSLIPRPVERSLPKVEDYLLPEWLPPQDPEVLKARIKNSQGPGSEPFRTNTKNNGGELCKPTYLRGKVLDEWVADRCVRPYKAYEKFVKGPGGQSFKPYRFRQQPELLKTWDMDLYPDHASLYWLDQPNTHVYDTGTQYQAEYSRHMPKREQHLYPIYYKQKRLEEEEKRFKKMQQSQLITRNMMTCNDDDDQPHFSEELAKKWEQAKANLKVTMHTKGGAASGKKDGQAKRSKTEEMFFKDRKVRHLDPFKYVNRNYYQLGLSLPYQLPAELLQMQREYLEPAKRSMNQSKRAAQRTRSEGDLVHLNVAL